MSLEPYFLDMMLAILLLAAALSDLSTRLIPNLLVGSGMVVALAWHFTSSGMPGVVFCVKGMALGMLLLIVPFFMGGMGAGDVKLLGMVGAFLGTGMVWNAFLWTALIGGVAAFIYLVANNRLLATMKRFVRPIVAAFLPWTPIALANPRDKEEPRLYLPYGVMIALGTLAAYWKSW